jgi:exodeoxyribonuclease V beta subunit
VAAINPEAHAVIEASAGTGKTYTLVELVKLLLIQGRAALDDILLVTYTEKAAGELKSRLRETLEQMLSTQPAHRETLLTALDSFDQAHVYTIHGFCQRVLQEYAFEYRQDFRSQLVSDPELLEVCLRELQRKTWRKEYGDLLPRLLELSGYARAKGGPAAWDALVLEIAKAYRPRCGHLLIPAPEENVGAELQQWETELRATRAALRELAGPLDGSCLEKHDWYQGFAQLPFQESRREPRRTKVLRPFLQWLADSAADDHPLAAFYHFVDRCAAANSFDKHGFRLLSTAVPANARERLAECCPNLESAVDALEEQRQRMDSESLENQLGVQTVLQLQAHVNAYKRERGLQSFEDLLTQVDQAVDPDCNPRAEAILTALRSRFRYAIVDEFQDTDPIQWRIFKRIFVEGGEGRRLFVVGDPKQAIFGFRGADLHAYQAAVAELKGRYAAAQYPLDVNWRSCPEMLQALNQLFEAGAWFAGTGIRFTPVGPPTEEERRFRILSDDTGRAALSLVDLTGPERLTHVRFLMARFIAGEIRRLLCPVNGQPKLTFQEKDQSGTRHLEARDICILVARRRDANPVQEALRAARIPYTLYKQTGLWQSPEALHLGYLLRAIARRGEVEAFHKALLTRFFRIHPEELACCEELPSEHPVRELFLRWCGLAEQRRWAALFSSLLEDTGLLFDNPDAPDAERRLANLRHLFQSLEQAAYSHDLDLIGILEFLKEKQLRPGDDDANLQPIETERPKVRIMTIHAAKGLEFPVVFLAGGFTEGRTRPYWSYREGENLVFDLRTGDATAKEAAGAESDAEYRRLYYVALTRAMFKLYVPKVSTEKSYRKAGPVATILAPAVEKADLMRLGRFCAQVVPSRDEGRGTRDEAFLIPDPSPIALGPSPLIPLPSDLFPRIDAGLSRRRIRVRSFSSLHHAAVMAAEVSYLDRVPRADDDTPDALEGADSLRGPVFGEMVHQILEEIDFSAGQAANPAALLADASPLVDSVVANYWRKLPARFRAEELAEETCRSELARLVWNGLHTPLDALGGPLAGVPREDRLHELEFHFPDQPLERSGLSADFLTGIIDLVVRRRDRYFLVDWKTNFLAGGYAPEAIAQNVRDCDYVLQYRLYLQALTRWLRRMRGASFDCDRDFGGVYYLYLRGMNGQDQSTGVFIHRPSAADLERGDPA